MPISTGVLAEMLSARFVTVFQGISTLLTALLEKLKKNHTHTQLALKKKHKVSSFIRGMADLNLHILPSNVLCQNDNNFPVLDWSVIIPRQICCQYSQNLLLLSPFVRKLFSFVLQN